MRGLLGSDYPGLFPVGDARRLAELLHRAEVDGRYYHDLVARCRRESYKFTPERERESLKILVERLFVGEHFVVPAEAALLDQELSGSRFVEKFGERVG